MSFEAELQAIEKDLSMLLVRFMKLRDAVEAAKAVAPIAPPPVPPTALVARATDLAKAYA